jgi:hypothetical protein
MSSIIERLTEGVVNRDMRAEGSALLSKWEKTGLLEGLDGDRKRNSMARLLENQAKELLRESSSLGAGDVEGFAAVAFPIVRRVFAGLIANDLVSVQPMSLPSGLIFFLDFVFSPDAGGAGAAGAKHPRMGNASGDSIYGSDEVGSQITGGVDLVGDQKQGFSGPLRDGATGYAYASPSGSQNGAIATANASYTSFTLNGSVTQTNKKRIGFDADLLAVTDSSLSVIVCDIQKAAILTTAGLVDYNNLSPFQLATTNLNVGGAGGAFADALGGVTTLKQIRRLTAHVASTDATIMDAGAVGGDAIRLVLAVGSGDYTADQAAAAIDNTINAADLTFPVADKIVASSTVGAVGGTGNLFALEGNPAIPEIDIKVDSIAVTAQTKKLKAKWTPELGQDLNAYHNLDAEVELTSILSEQVALEIDREILADLVNGATAATYYWSRSPGLFVNRETGAELGATSAAPDFTGTVSEWYETLVETINDVSAAIHRKTLRGGANFVVCGPEVANILEFTAGFRASVTHDDETGSIGAVTVGSLSKKFDVIVDPYFLRNVVLIGRRGSSFLESGYVYAPYVPLQTTPTIFGPEDFVPRKGVMTRYAKQMVRPDMYGLVICRGLLGESGA